MKHKFELVCVLFIIIVILSVTIIKLGEDKLFIYKIIDGEEIEVNYIERRSKNSLENILVYQKFKKEDINIKWLNAYCGCQNWHCKNEDSETCDLWRKTDGAICFEWRCWKEYYARFEKQPVENGK